MAENEHHLECKLGSTIQLLVPRPSPSLTTWSFNGKDVTIPYDHKKGFIKRNADLKDSGRYECKEDCIVTCVINVIVYDFLKCDLGSTIHIGVNTGSICQTWTVNEQEVKSEIDPFNGFEKRNADVSDSGKYKCTVEGRVTNFFYVTVYDFNIGRIGPIRFYTERKISSDTKDDIPIMSDEYGYMDREEVNQISSIYLVKEEENESHQTTYCYDKIFHEYYFCKVGSEINLKYRSQCVSPTWTLDDKDVISECNPRDGFKKKKSVLKDSGKYECKENNIVERIFDVFVYGTYEFKFGSTIRLGMDMACMDLKGSEEFKWTLDGEVVSSECDKHKGFEKTNADFTDSGKYMLNVDNKVTNVFEVIVYEYLFGNECLGIRITVPGEAAMIKPDILSKQIQTDKCGSSSLHGNAIFPAIDRTGKTGKWRNFIYSLGDQCMSIFKKGIQTKGMSEEETKGAFEEEIKCAPEEQTKCTTEKEKKDNMLISKISMSSNIQHVHENTLLLKKSISRDISSVKDNTVTSQESNYGNMDHKRGKLKTSMGTTTHNIIGKLKTFMGTTTHKIIGKLKTFMGTTTHKIIDEMKTYLGIKKTNKQDKKKISEYSMNRKPRGIAVIITIGTFDGLNNLVGLENDAKRCKTVFEALHFDVEICKATTAKGVDAFLTYISEICHYKYDCFMLLFGSHGGNGYLCCSDFNNGNATGFIEIYDLLEKFTSVDSLVDKPKIFFFDSCRQTNQNIAVQLPIRAENNARRLADKCRHLLVGYAAVVGTTASGNEAGGTYTQQLTSCLEQLAKTESFIDVVTEVHRYVYKESGKILPGQPDEIQVSTIDTTLEHRIIMRDLNLYNWHFFQYLIYTVLALLFCFFVFELCPF